MEAKPVASVFFLLFSELLPNLLNTLNRPRAKAQRMGLARRTASGKRSEDGESRCSRCFPGKKEIICKLILRYLIIVTSSSKNEIGGRGDRQLAHEAK